jgi:hypothetical protein
MSGYFRWQGLEEDLASTIRLSGHPRFLGSSDPTHVRFLIYL